MGKFWSILFGATMLACLGLFLVAPLVGWWLPAAHSTHAWNIDFLFYVILFVTGFFFILTEAILVAFMFRYGSQDDGTPPKPGPSVVGNLLRPVTGVLNEPHKIEIAWTIVPAAILLYIAFAQIGAWAEVKYQSRYQGFVGNKTPVVAEVSARQFEWRVRYPSKDRQEAFLDNKEQDGFKKFPKSPHFDDVHVVNEVHCYKDHPVLIHLVTRDVIHSFNLPHMRVKQDALPGKMIPLWFIPTEANTYKNPETGKWQDGYRLIRNDKKEVIDGKRDKSRIWDLACAELCGWGHYRMVGRLYVHENKADFLEWLQATQTEQNQGKN